MTEIAGFRGVRYDTAVIRDVSKVVTLPYDKIDDAARERYYGRHELNVVRATSAKTMPSDHDGDNRYTRARDTLGRFLNDGFIVRDLRPAVYPYQTAYRMGGGPSRVRNSFLALVRVGGGDSASHLLLPHERTMPKPFADRLQLLRIARCHLGPIFLLYDDPTATAERLFQRVSAGPAATEAMHENERHRVWIADDPAIVSEVAATLAPLACVVADGHHRLKVAAAYAEETPDDPSAQFRMAAFVNVAGGNAVDILPTHRLLKGSLPAEPAAIELSLRSLGPIREFPAGEEGEAEMIRELARARAEKRRAIGIVLPRAKKATLLLELDPFDVPELDVEFLHEKILAEALAVSPEASADRLLFVRGTNDALSRLRAEGHAAAFLLNGVSVAEVFGRANAGRLVPQKTTDFHPKFLTGMVMNLLGDDAARIAAIPGRRT
jgi:uncharacterized protein (DUF1015 family)